VHLFIFEGGLYLVGLCPALSNSYSFMLCFVLILKCRCATRLDDDECSEHGGRAAQAPLALRSVGAVDILIHAPRLGCRRSRQTWPPSLNGS
jgi:hypothetical protein